MIKNFDPIIIEQDSDDIHLPNIKINFDGEKEEPICIKSPTQKIIVSEENEGCVQKDCSIENHYACPSESGFFSIENLFSELTTDYQRAVIRQNLGIGDSQSLLWGKIQGNLANQEDLCRFVKEIAQADVNEIIDILNLKLEYWTNHIENKIESRASNITSITLTPMYESVMKTPIDVLVSWEYANEVESQKINGYEIQPNTRNFLIEGITETKDITLSYLLQGVWMSRTVTFTVYAPTYYGISDNYENCQQTMQSKFKINALEDQFIYILTANPSDFSVNGFIGGFLYEGVTYINSRKYYIYRSMNSGLGNTTVTIHDPE